MMRRRRGGAIVTRQMSERRIAEPKLVLTRRRRGRRVAAVGVVAIADNRGDAWLVLLTALCGRADRRGGSSSDLRSASCERVV
jgi:hypothetical protein